MKMIPTVRKIGKSRTIENKPGFFAKDVPTLIHVLLDLREIGVVRHKVLIGADDGHWPVYVKGNTFLNFTQGCL